MIQLKVGRNVLNITQDDLIMDNGSCYQIITQEVGCAFNKIHPRVSKKLFKELKDLELIFTNDELKRKAEKMYTMIPANLYKFDIDRMKQLGY